MVNVLGIKTCELQLKLLEGASIADFFIRFRV